MTHLAIKPRSKYAVVHHHKTVGEDLNAAKILRINTPHAFNASYLGIAYADLTIVTPKEQKQKGYLVTKRNLLLVTLVYSIILVAVLIVVL
jgi:hypothetical protein